MPRPPRPRPGSPRPSRGRKVEAARRGPWPRLGEPLHAAPVRTDAPGLQESPARSGAGKVANFSQAIRSRGPPRTPPMRGAGRGRRPVAVLNPTSSGAAVWTDARTEPGACPAHSAPRTPRTPLLSGPFPDLLQPPFFGNLVGATHPRLVGGLQALRSWSRHSSAPQEQGQKRKGGVALLVSGCSPTLSWHLVTCSSSLCGCREKPISGRAGLTQPARPLAPKSRNPADIPPLSLKWPLLDSCPGPALCQVSRAVAIQTSCFSFFFCYGLTPGVAGGPNGVRGNRSPADQCKASALSIVPSMPPALSLLNSLKHRPFYGSRSPGATMEDTVTGSFTATRVFFTAATENKAVRHLLETKSSGCAEPPAALL